MSSACASMRSVRKAARESEMTRWPIGSAIFCAIFCGSALRSISTLVKTTSSTTGVRPRNMISHSLSAIVANSSLILRCPRTSLSSSTRALTPSGLCAPSKMTRGCSNMTSKRPGQRTVCKPRRITRSLMEKLPSANSSAARARAALAR